MRKIGVVGLGYVGLPLAVAFGEKTSTVGFDINETRINQLKEGVDITGECSSEKLSKSGNLTLTYNKSSLKECSIFIITVPTPVTKNNNPDLGQLISASELVAQYLDLNDIVIYESTVFPGATEEVCVPVLERVSGLKYNAEFFCGYSPERINPGDKANTLENIVKVTSGSNELVAQIVDDLYREIIRAGTHRASSIRVAEASKVIENTQRDVNIAFVNELSMIFDKIGIPSKDVLEAASTKWNFQYYKPGLVGGHCIGVDPYYLISKSQEHGFYPSLISASRRINEGMADFVINKMLREMVSEYSVVPKKIAILGATFKEDCPDLRNSQSFRMYDIAKSLNIDVDLYDPYASVEDCRERFGYEISNELVTANNYDCIIFAVAHTCYKKYGQEFLAEISDSGVKVVVDIKSIFSDISSCPGDLKIVGL